MQEHAICQSFISLRSLWNCGSVEVWNIRGATFSRTPNLQSPDFRQKDVEAWNCGIVELWNCGIVEALNSSLCIMNSSLFMRIRS